MAVGRASNVPFDVNMTQEVRAFLDDLDKASIRSVNLVDAVNDAAAALGGVQIGGIYRNGSVLMIRIT